MFGPMPRRLFVSSLLSLAAAAVSGGCADSSSDRAADWNTELALDRLHITPREPFAYHRLQADGLDFSAAMGSGEDGVRFERLVWFVNGEEVHRGTYLESRHITRDDIVELHLLDEDGARVSARDHVTVLNSMPRISGVSLALSRDEGNVLVCHASSIDADNEEIQYEYEWTLDGQRFAGARGPKVQLRDLKKGQRIGVIVRAFDGAGYSQPFRPREYVINNLPPSIAEVGDAVVRSMENGTRIFRLQLDISDPDGDSLDVRFSGVPSSYDWNGDSGVLQWVLDGPAEARTIQVRVSDGRGAAIQHQLEIAGETVPGR